MEFILNRFIKDSAVINERMWLINNRGNNRAGD